MACKGKVAPLFGAAFLSFCAPGSAAAGRGVSTAVQTAPAACAELFGSAPAQRALAAARRRRFLHAVDASGFSIQVYHSNEDWTRPVARTLKDASLSCSFGDRDRASSCTVALSRPMAGCPTGRYTIGVDDALGDLRILSFTPGWLIAESEGRLVYVLLDRSGGTPTFASVWSSPWSINPHGPWNAMRSPGRHSASAAGPRRTP
jgi:hypothetical protein